LRKKYYEETNPIKKAEIKIKLTELKMKMKRFEEIYFKYYSVIDVDTNTSEYFTGINGITNGPNGAPEHSSVPLNSETVEAFRNAVSNVSEWRSSWQYKK